MLTIGQCESVQVDSLHEVERRSKQQLRAFVITALGRTKGLGGFRQTDHEIHALLFDLYVMSSGSDPHQPIDIPIQQTGQFQVWQQDTQGPGRGAAHRRNPLAFRKPIAEPL
ncbi:hypothetical protein LCL61_18145 [Amycolatopsis coloradensis]|uniref:Uncharacterized protein n=1 Tax=Amycolatopsis coloradensis TaxID=76021 RepID=A0ACD5BDH5_9PSEU